MIGKGDKHDALYVLHARDLNISSPVSSTFANTVSARIWHERLGHLSFQRLKLLRPQLHCNNKHLNHDPCYLCPLAKQHRLSFSSNNHMSKSPFDLVHCDIWGPYHVTSISGYRYFLTLVDDCTRFTWVFLLRIKSNVIHIVPKLFNIVENQFNKRIKVFRSDNAKELAFTDFFAQKGVLHQFSYMETPQENFVVERRHQHLLNVARALYFQSHIPI